MRVSAPDLRRVAGIERRAVGRATDIEREVERVLVQLRALRHVPRPRITNRSRPS